MLLPLRNIACVVDISVRIRVEDKPPFSVALSISIPNGKISMNTASKDGRSDDTSDEDT